MLKVKGIIGWASFVVVLLIFNWFMLTTAAEHFAAANDMQSIGGTVIVILTLICDGSAIVTIELSNEE